MWMAAGSKPSVTLRQKHRPPLFFVSEPWAAANINCFETLILIFKSWIWIPILIFHFSQTDLLLLLTKSMVCKCLDMSQNVSNTTWDSPALAFTAFAFTAFAVALLASLAFLAWQDPRPKGATWISLAMKTRENPWKIMETHGNPWKTMENDGKS